MRGQSERMRSRNTHKHKYTHLHPPYTHTHTHNKGETAWGSTWHHMSVIQRRQVVTVNINEVTDEKKGCWDSDKGGDGAVVGWVGGSGGLSLSSLPSWRTKRPRQSPYVTYCTLHSQLPCFLSPLEWCHRPAGDVTSTHPNPLRLSPLSPLSSSLQSLASHCAPGTVNGARTKHRHKHTQWRSCSQTQLDQT